MKNGRDARATVLHAEFRFKTNPLALAQTIDSLHNVKFPFSSRVFRVEVGEGSGSRALRGRLRTFFKRATRQKG